MKTALLGQHLASLRYGNCRDLPHALNVLFSEKSVLRENPVLLIEKFSSLVLLRNAIMLQHLIIQFAPHCPSSGRLREVENNRNFQTLGSKSGCGRLREVVAHKRFEIK